MAVVSTEAPAAPQCLICERPISKIGVRTIDRLVTGEGPFDVLVCPDCQLGVTEPRMDDRELAHFYTGKYYEAFCEWDGPHRGSPLVRARAAWRQWSARRRAGRRPFAPLPVSPPGRVLDVGCGDGRLLATFASRGFEAIGLDPSDTAVEAVRRRGLQAHWGTLDDHPWDPGTFKVILFQHALEHIPDPMASLREASRLLAPGGVVVIAVPNWGSWQRRLYGGHWSHLELPRHQQHFSPRALERAAESVGLRPVEVGTESNVISPAYSIHYLIAGRWTAGWKLWLSYALGVLVFPITWVIDRRFGGDCCYLIAERPAS